MRLGYILWIAGWLALLGGIALIVVAVLQAFPFGIGRGILIFFCGLGSLLAGANRISKARHEQELKHLEQIKELIDVEIEKRELEEKDKPPNRRQS